MPNQRLPPQRRPEVRQRLGQRSGRRWLTRGDLTLTDRIGDSQSQRVRVRPGRRRRGLTRRATQPDSSSGVKTGSKEPLTSVSDVEIRCRGPRREATGTEWVRLLTARPVDQPVARRAALGTAVARFLAVDTSGRFAARRQAAGVRRRVDGRVLHSRRRPRRAGPDGAPDPRVARRAGVPRAPRLESRWIAVRGAARCRRTVGVTRQVRLNVPSPPYPTIAIRPISTIAAHGRAR
jgi:hypothetical protein